MRKKLIFSVIATFSAFVAIVFSTCFSSSRTTNALGYESEGTNFEVVFPDVANYLYLKDPALVAVDGDAVAVYDAASSTIYTAGSTHEEYDVSSLLSDDEKPVSLWFSGGKIRFLTNLAAIYRQDNGSFVKITNPPEDFKCAYACDNVTYFYYGTGRFYAYDDENFVLFSDASKKIIDSSLFAVSDNIAYFYKEGVVYKLNLDEDTPSSSVLAENVEADKMVASENRLFALKDDILTVIDVGTGEKTLSSFENAKDIASDGAKLAVLPASDNAVYTYDAKDLSFIDTYGCASKKDFWFDRPENITVTNGTISVWDKNNGRIQRISPDAGQPEKIAIPENAACATSYDDNYACFSEGILSVKTSSDPRFKDYFVKYDVTAMSLCDDSLYVYDAATNAVYVSGIKSEPDFSMFSYVGADVKKIVAVGNENKTVYASDGNNVFVLSSSGTVETLKPDGYIVSFDVDAQGNVIVLLRNGGDFVLTGYDRNFNGFVLSDSLILKGDFEVVNLVDVALDTINGTAYLIDGSKNVLIKTDSANFVKTGFSPSDPVGNLSVNPEKIFFVKSKGTVVYKYADDFIDVLETPSAGVVLAVLHETEDAYYVLTENGATGYVSKTDNHVVSARENSLNGSVTALWDNVNVYDFPSKNAPKITVGQKQILGLVSDCADFNSGGKWLKVSYSAGGETVFGYVYKTSVMTYVAPREETAEPVYAKAKSSRVGVTVPVYAMADASSAVAFEVADGTKLKLLEDYDADRTFTRVEYNGKTGYVLTSALLFDKGLTGGQIAAIVLSSVTAIITVLYLILARRNKKISNK